MSSSPSGLYIKDNQPYATSGSIDDDGFRNYQAIYLVHGDAGVHNIFSVAYCPGLPVPGSPWIQDAEIDPWVWCLPAKDIVPVEGQTEGTPVEWWLVTCHWTNRPAGGPGIGGGGSDRARCHDTPIEDPLLEPQRVSGGFTKFSEEATVDRFGLPITNSAHEPFRGAQVEFDEGNDLVRIEQNVPILQLDLLSAMKNTLNQFPLWGFGPRIIKFINYTWEKKWYGQCLYYYTRSLEFEVSRKGWDRALLDKGTMVLNGHWNTSTNEWVLDTVPNYQGSPNPNPNTPAHFIRFKDKNDEAAEVILDGTGKPWNPVEQSVFLYPTSVADNGPVFFTDSANTTGVPDGVVATWSSGIFAGQQNGDLVLLDFALPDETFPAAADQFAIANVILSVSLENNIPAGATTGGLFIEARIGAVGAWTLLYSTNGPYGANNSRAYDISSLVAGSWDNLSEVRVRVRIEISQEAGFARQYTLDGVGLYVTGYYRPGYRYVQKYNESDFLLLGIPLSW